MTYNEFQEKVYKYLMKEHKKNGFTFSFRKRVTKGAEANYFIGTEKSGYFALTFWNIPVAYPGSSSDLINLVFKWSENGIGYRLEFGQTNTPHDEQNKGALDLIILIKDRIKNVLDIHRESTPKHKMYNYNTAVKWVDYSDVNALIKEAIKFVNEIKQIVTEGILEVKSSLDSFQGDDISESEFLEDHERMILRRKKHSGTNDGPETTISDEPELENGILFEKKPSLNQIFYGPPGTGKTYKTIEEAVKICNPSFDVSQDRQAVKNEYMRLFDARQIAFTTFHQSTSYEDFVEGIKPQVVDEGITYEVESGIFKEICQRAKTIVAQERKDINWDNCRYFKMSLGGKERSDIHDWCIDNEVIALGYGGTEDLSSFKKGLKDFKTFREIFTSKYPELVQETKYHIQAAYSFWNLKKGDIVLVSKGNSIVDAIGVITSDYFFNPDEPIEYSHFRKVDWIATDLHTPPSRFVNKNLSQMSIYEFREQDIITSAFEELSKSKEDQDLKNYVLIIDEINRANVAQVFGELITLLEPDKRLGEKEELTVTLPYSKNAEKPFGVPNNVYVIGTMNTADKSVEALDSALRRRFNFIEVAPNPAIIKTQGELSESDGILTVDNEEEINLSLLLEIINARIELLLDKHHKIGHSYFLSINTIQDLKETFDQKLIPLLEEYFFGDYGKLALVIGEGFCTAKPTELNLNLFAHNTHEYEHLLGDKTIYNIKNCARLSDDDFFKGIKSLLNQGDTEETDDAEE